MRYRVLEMLAASASPLSGEKISGETGVSRAMVWKLVSALRKEGYDVHGDAGKGYSLVSRRDVLNAHEAGSGMYGSEMIYFRELDSTNTFLKTLAQKQVLPEGTCVICDAQTGGRGRLGRQWHTPAFSNISMSVLLRPDCGPEDAAGISLMAGVCVFEVLKEYGIKGLRLKWPNDILIGSRKVCGILTEMVSEAEHMGFLVTGTGINVFGKADRMPGELSTIATTLEEAIGDMGGIRRAEIIRKIICAFESEYQGNKSGLSAQTIEKWEAYSQTAGRRIRYTLNGETKEGTIAGLDRHGALIVASGSDTDLVRSGAISETE